MSGEQLQILQHSLGVDRYGQGRMYRNHYVGGAEECRPLVAMGYMTEHPASEITGGDVWFRVTESGKTVMLTESPKPPRLSRSQKRYREFLRADTGASFREWLSCKAVRG